MSDSVERAFLEALGRVAVGLGAAAREGTVALARRFGLEGLAMRHGFGDRGDEGLRDAARVRRFGEEALLESARELSAALARYGVPHVFVRGAALIGGYYRPGDRQLVDLDLLVPRAHAERVQSILRGLGYAEDPRGDETGPPGLRPVREFRRSASGGQLDLASVDLHWGLVPVEHLLPRPHQEIPDDVWMEASQAAGVCVPAAEPHLALLVHHLVTHDLLHARGVLDFALIVDSLGGAGGSRFESVAQALGVLRAARAVHEAVVRDLGATPLRGVGAPPGDWRGKRLRRVCGMEAWLRLAATAGERELREITPARIRRRMVLADRATWDRMARDALWPPAEYLRWRWPDLDAARARTRHVIRALRKLVGRPT